MPTSPSSVPRGQDTNSQAMVRSFYREAGVDPDKQKFLLSQKLTSMALDRVNWEDKYAQVSAKQADAIQKAYGVLKDAIGGGNGVAMDDMSDEELEEIAGAITAKTG